MNVLTITNFGDAKEIYRHKDFRQALYDAGEIVMGDVIINLHGEEHRARRRLENRLFRRETLVHYERDLFPRIISETLDPWMVSGRAELVELSHQIMMNLAALNAGLDRPQKTVAETKRLYSYMMKFIEGATLAHTTRDPAVVTREIADAKAQFDSEFLGPSINRRSALIEQDDGSGDGLPKDVLTILLKNEDSLHIPREVMLREIAFFLLAGAHTSATAFVRTLDHLFAWFKQNPGDEARARSDKKFVQSAVYETIRLFPSSPVAMRRATSDIKLKSGTVVKAGETVTVDLMSVNRDPTVFGSDAGVFNPTREPLESSADAWGLSFGHGMHACIGQELAAGLIDRSADTAEFEYGLVSVAVQALLDRGAAPDPARPPMMDTTTKRPYWGEYHVLLG
jgi:cytochrome P450